MEKWEYKFFEMNYRSNDDDETQFNVLGEQGWELAGVIPNVSGEIRPNSSGHTQGETYTIVKYIFKRRKRGVGWYDDLPLR